MISTNQTNHSQSSCYNNTHNNSNSNIILGRNNSHSNNPKVIAPTSPDLFPNFKTKRFSSNVVLQITPSIRSELNGLNNNLTKIKNDLVELNGQNSSAYVDSRSPQVKSLNLSANLDDNKPDILLVDDEEFNLSSLQSLLKIEKLTVDTACNGEDAIRLIQENPSFKLIFMDVYMPIMDGIQACKIIQEMYQQGQVNQKVSVIIVSAHSKETIIHQIEKLTVVKKFCQKPLNRKKLKSILQEYYYS
jgi:CheY-like chemotaxis protein